MAKEKITTLVEQLHDKLISKKPSELNEVLLADEIRKSNYREDKAANEKFLEHMLNLMGYFTDNSNPLQWKTPNNPPTKSEIYFRKLFWLDSYCREFLLQDLLGSVTNTPQMAVIFQSFEYFYGLPEYRRSASKILSVAFEYLPPESTWLAYYYSCSEKVEPNNKREAVVENNLRNFDQYYNEQPQTLSNVLEKNKPVSQKITADATSLGNAFRKKLKEFLGETLWNFLGLWNPLDENISEKLASAAAVKPAVDDGAAPPAEGAAAAGLDAVGLIDTTDTSRFDRTVVDENSNEIQAAASLDDSAPPQTRPTKFSFLEVPPTNQSLDSDDERFLVSAQDEPVAPTRKSSCPNFFRAIDPPSPIRVTKPRAQSLDETIDFLGKGL